MAKYIWSGQSFGVAIANKQRDNTGIKNIVLSGYDDDFILASKSATVTNAAAGNRSASVGTFTASLSGVSYYSTMSSSSVTVDGITCEGNKSLNVEVNWNGGGKSDSHAVQELFVANPITGISASANSTTIWTDSTLKVNVTASGDNAFKTNGKVSFTTTNNVFNLSDGVIGSNTFNHDTSVSINKSTTFTITATSLSGAPDVAGAMAGASYSSTTKTITVKNAVKSISLNNETTDSTIYVTNGGSASAAYALEAYNAGTLYSSEVTKSTDVNADIATASLSGNLVVITGVSVGTTKLKLKSTNAATDKYSPLLTIIVMPASTTIYLNPGDTWTASVPTGSKIDSKYSDYNTDAATGSISNTTLTITAGTTAGKSKVKVVAGGAETIYTVQVEHVTVTVS